MTAALASKPVHHPVAAPVGPLVRDLFAATPLYIFAAAFKSAISQKRG